MRKTCVFLALLFLGSLAGAQQPSPGPPTDADAVLLKRIAELEDRVQNLEKQLTAAPANAPAASQPQAAQLNEPSIPVPEPDGAATHRHLGFGGLNVRVFGQAEYIADDLHGDRPVLDIGNLTLLMTSQLSDHLSALGEVAFDEGGYGGPDFTVSVERLLLQYQQNDYFKIGAGRYFTSIGYYNTAFENADWAQTTMRRPIIVEFMDQGGPLPTQRNGLTASGRLSSSTLGLHYIAEIGTGDMQRTDILQLGYEFPYQARTAYNLALFVRPERFRGLQVGGSYYHDTVLPISDGVPVAVVRQGIYSGYVVYNNSRWEWLNESYWIHHQVVGFRDYNTPAFYTQISRRMTSAIRPYFRYTWINASGSNPVFGDVSRASGVETGVRYNFSEWVGLKTEYDRLHVRDFTPVNVIGSQLAFTF